MAKPSLSRPILARPTAPKAAPQLPADQVPKSQPAAGGGESHVAEDKKTVDLSGTLASLTKGGGPTPPVGGLFEPDQPAPDSSPAQSDVPVFSAKRSASFPATTSSAPSPLATNSSLAPEDVAVPPMDGLTSDAASNKERGAAIKGRLDKDLGLDSPSPAAPKLPGGMDGAGEGSAPKPGIEM